MAVLNFKDYQVAWIAPLRIEVRAALKMLDNVHDGNFESDAGDDYQYIGGDINGHNIIIATFPLETAYGGNSAAALASQVKKCMGNSLWFGLLVGIAAGLPNPQKDIRLGDVLICTKVIQHDMGKQTTEGFVNTSKQADSLQFLRSVFTKIDDLTEIKGHPFLQHLSRVQDVADDQGKFLFRDPGEENDVQYKEVGRREVREQRQPRNEHRTRTWYGAIGSGNTLVKSSKERDELRDLYEIVGLEMEAHGTMNTIPVGHIRGVCDYADKRKNDDWHGFAAAVAAAYAREVLCEINPRRVVNADVQWLVPFGRNKNFVGRESQLEELVAKSNPNGNKENCQRVAVTGLGGIGKTQLALETAFRIKELSHCSVFWVPAIDIASSEQAYREIGVKLGVHGIDDDKADIKLLVQRALSKKTSSWLMIIDNADDMNILYAETSRLVDYPPFNQNGSILLTTRNFEIATEFSETDVITVEEMFADEAQDLLEKSLGTKVQADERDDMRRLLQLLTNLPLAIKQAAAFMRGKKKSISTYLRVYSSSDTELIRNLTLNFEDQGRYRGYKNIRNPIAATWLITFEAITQSDLAHQYLCFMFCVAAKDIPRSLLPLASDREQEDATAVLEQYAFITPRNAGASYDMHRLVHLAGQNWLKSQETWTLWSTKSLSQVAKVFPFCDHKERHLCLQV
ncbi:hypothetical protein HYALB_00009363 [Hymenoscyphus albidus]|uniref:NB-ARC domain-containing protein n=1 Tax=Hymenoscyphus albidus TaxID=595503 RepID=A0A9N9Q2I6_9HELO|nr:hypothetical protein HYALB_00009363 [Hymenoscyphus albidus]